METSKIAARQAENWAFQGEIKQKLEKEVLPGASQFVHATLAELDQANRRMVGAMMAATDAIKSARGFYNQLYALP